ncbi:hypothetical protein FPV67DRAFT_7781 [Lyophyllum atratum]|nr:hypothetical protein FPV67DRAFT_7781 [Lyophyllum atratum]
MSGATPENVAMPQTSSRSWGSAFVAIHRRAFVRSSEGAGRTGIPHRSMQDDMYKGYLIPKDSIILPHMWSITRDPHLYSDPHMFRPNRFLAAEAEAQDWTPIHISTAMAEDRVLEETLQM